MKNIIFFKAIIGSLIGVIFAELGFLFALEHRGFSGLTIWFNAPALIFCWGVFCFIVYKYFLYMNYDR